MVIPRTDNPTNVNNNKIFSALNSGARSIDAGGDKKELNLRKLKIPGPMLKAEGRDAHTSDKRIGFVIQCIGIVPGPLRIHHFPALWYFVLILPLSALLGREIQSFSVLVCA